MTPTLKVACLRIQEAFAKALWKFSTLNKKHKSLLGAAAIAVCLLWIALACIQRQHQQEKLSSLRVDEYILMEMFAEFKSLPYGAPPQLSESLLSEILQAKGIPAKHIEWKVGTISIQFENTNFSQLVDFLSDMQKHMRWRVNTARIESSRQNDELKRDAYVNVDVQLVSD